jgi:hypothetical protein
MDEIRISVAFLALAGCLVHGGCMVVCSCLGKQPVHYRPAGLVVILALLLMVGASRLGQEILPIEGLGLIIVTVTVWIAIQTYVWRFPKHQANRWCLVVAHAALLCAAIEYFHTIACQPLRGLDIAAAAEKVPAEDAVLVTDQGRIFTVFHFETPDRMVHECWQEVFRHKIVRTAPPDLQTNCHGWVFANGRYGLTPTAVAAILQDNGYSTVESPQPGDVIVYWDDAGGIVHSGRVHRVHEDGQVWIESKWGPGGRFLHRPQDQCYSNSYAFYRSSRPTHEAQLVVTATGKEARVAKFDHVPLRRARG